MGGASTENLYDVVVIGGGPAGLTAALYLARARYRVVVLEKEQFGGQITITSEVVNYPGIEKTDGKALTESMRRQAQNFGAEFLLTKAEALDCSGDVKKVKTSRGTLECFGILLATGAHPRMVGFAGEQEFQGHGVAYCATCDGMFYKGKTVAVIGGGNTAAADALQLSRICEKVIVVHRRDTLRATKIYHQPLMDAPNVEFRWNCVVDEILHDEKVTGLVLKDARDGSKSVIQCEGVFVSVGRKPQTEMLEGQLDLDSQGYIIADESTVTNIPGVFAVGDVRTKPLRQVVTAVSDGAVSAHYAEEYLAAQRL